MKKTKKSALFDTLYGLLIVFVLVGVIGIFGGISSAFPDSNNGGTSNVEPEEELFTIEAGTYVFDDRVPHYRWPEENIPLFFTCSWVDSSGTLVYTEAKSINFYRDVIMGEHVWNVMDYGFTTYMYGDESQTGWSSVYKCKSRPGLNVCEEEWGDEGYKTIVVPYDQQVSQAAGKWTDIYLTRVENTEGDVGNPDNSDVIYFDGNIDVPSFPNPMNPMTGDFYLVSEFYTDNSDLLYGTFEMSNGESLTATPVPYYDETGRIVAFSLSNHAMVIKEGSHNFEYNGIMYSVNIPVSGIYFFVPKPSFSSRYPISLTFLNLSDIKQTASVLSVDFNVYDYTNTEDLMCA